MSRCLLVQGRECKSSRTAEPHLTLCAEVIGERDVPNASKRILKAEASASRQERDDASDHLAAAVQELKPHRAPEVTEGWAVFFWKPEGPSGLPQPRGSPWLARGRTYLFFLSSQCALCAASVSGQALQRAKAKGAWLGSSTLTDPPCAQKEIIS